MKNKKKIIIIVIIIIGVFLLSYGVFCVMEKFNNQSKNNDNTNTNNNSVYVPITSYENKNTSKELNISNLIIKKEKKKIILNFELINNLDKILKDEMLKIHFYQNNKLVDTFNYPIVELNSGDSLSVNIEYDTNNLNINKYEFEVDGFKTIVSPQEQ